MPGPLLGILVIILVTTLTIASGSIILLLAFIEQETKAQRAEVT